MDERGGPSADKLVSQIETGLRLTTDLFETSYSVTIHAARPSGGAVEAKGGHDD